MSNSALTLWVDEQLLDMPSADICEIARRGDSIKNGFFIGAGVGAGMAAIAAAVNDEPQYLAGAPINAAFWGGIGVLVDYLIKGRTVVFKAASTALRLRPDVSVGPRGASVSMMMSTQWSR